MTQMAKRPVSSGIPFWLDDLPSTNYPALDRDASFDVAIVGGGIVGLQTAHRLQDLGISVVLLEARRVGQQATGRSTAKVTSQHRLKYRSLLDNFGEEAARLYAKANEEAVSEISRLAAAMDRDTQFSRKTAYVYAQDEADIEALRGEHDAARHLGLACQLVEEAGLPFRPPLLLAFAQQAQIDPAAYLAGLAGHLSDKIAIHEDSRVEEIEYGDPCRLAVNGHTVTARQVVLATQMPIANDGFFFTKAYPLAHPIAAAPLPKGLVVDGMFVTAGSPSRSFRTAQMKGSTYLIAAGSEYKTGEENQEREGIEDLLTFMKEGFGIREVTHLWTSEDFRPMDGVPFIGAASSSKPNLFVATGFAAWGLTMGVVAADIIAAHIAGKRHEAAELFAANRLKPLLGGGTFIKENTMAGAHMVGDRLLRRHAVAIEDIAPGKGGVITRAGEHIAVIRNRDGTIHAMSAVCTHLGCVLGWNETDRTFDCPCHGSRFDEHGEVLFGPATAPLEARDLE